MAIIVVGVLIISHPWRPVVPPLTYSLSTDVSPSGAGSVSPSNGTYEPGVQVILTASPASGYTFDHWSGSASGNTSSIAITMHSDENLTANFKAEGGTSQTPYVPDEILVSFKPGVNQTVQDELLQSYNLTKIGEIPDINVEVLKVNPNELDAVIEALSHNPNVEYAEKNGIGHVD